MSYKIAVASSDGKNVDTHFGKALFFYIYTVDDEAEVLMLEKREVPQGKSGSVSKEQKSCGNGSGCSCGSSGADLDFLSDVRAVVAAKIGFNVTKQLEKKAIAGFDVECSVQEALEKITGYFYKTDRHISLAKRN